MKKLEQLELIEVEENDGALTLTFLDEENGLVRDVQFHKKKFDREKKKWIQNDEQEKFVEEKVLKYLGTTYDDAVNAIGQRHDVYCYPKFNSLWESSSAEKFTKEEVGEIFETVIKSIEDNGIALVTKFEHDGKVYESRMTYAKYIESMKKWFPDPIKMEKQLAKFEEKYGIEFGDRDELIGRKIMVEVKEAFNKYPYAEIKKLPKKK